MGWKLRPGFCAAIFAISFLFRKLQSWLFRTSSDWMKPLHFRKGNLPYSKSTDLNVTHILKIPSQQHQTSVWPNNWEASATLTQKTNPNSWNPSCSLTPASLSGWRRIWKCWDFSHDRQAVPCPGLLCPWNRVLHPQPGRQCLHPEREKQSSDPTILIHTPYHEAGQPTWSSRRKLC